MASLCRVIVMGLSYICLAEGTVVCLAYAASRFFSQGLQLEPKKSLPFFLFGTIATFLFVSTLSLHKCYCYGNASNHRSVNVQTWETKQAETPLQHHRSPGKPFQCPTHTSISIRVLISFCKTQSETENLISIH